MKKLLFSAFIVTTTILGPTLPSFAVKDCPTIPNNIKEVTVKSNSVFLRKEPKRGGDKGFTINEGDKLKVLENKPEIDKDGKDNCWYKVSSFKDSSNGQYFIAGNVGLQEFSSFSKPSTGGSKPNPNGQGSTSNPNKGETPLTWEILLLLQIGGIVIAGLLLYGIDQLKIARDNRFRKNSGSPTFDESAHSISSTIEKYFPQLIQEIKELNEQNFANRELINQDKSIEQDPRFIELIEKYNTIIEQNSIIINFLGQSVKNEQQEVAKKSIKEEKQEERDVSEKNQNIDETRIESNDSTQSPSSTEVPDAQPDTFPLLSTEVTEIVNNFNKQNIDYFRHSRFQPLTLTQESIHGQGGLDAKPIVELVLTDDRNDTYLKVEFHQESWLIPNITSNRFPKLLHNLSQNSQMFIVNTSSDRSQLVRPAKLKEIKSGIWGIEEPGKFTQEQ